MTVELDTKTGNPPMMSVCLHRNAKASSSSSRKRKFSFKNHILNLSKNIHLVEPRKYCFIILFIAIVIIKMVTNNFELLCNSVLLPRCTWYDLKVTPDHPSPPPPPPRVIKAVSILMHSPLLSIHFYHTKSSLFFTPFIHLFLATYNSHIRSILFTNWSFLLYSLHVSKPPQHTALLNQPTLLTPVLLHSSSFLTQHTYVYPCILLSHLISITFNLFFSIIAIYHHYLYKWICWFYIVLLRMNS